MILWSHLARAAVSLAARLEMCAAVESMRYSMYQYNSNGEGGTYEGRLYLTDDYYIVIAKRVRHDVKD